MKENKNKMEKELKLKNDEYSLNKKNSKKNMKKN